MLAGMADVTEIYCCKAGQKLRDGKLSIDNSITNREQAEPDARKRCQHDPKIERVAYYAVSEDERFRNFFTYTNPAGKTEAAGEAGKPKAKSKKKKTPAKKPLLKRLRSFFEE
jgi:hypothetical protein